MRLVQAKSSGLTTFQGELLVRAKSLLVHQNSSRLTTLRGKSAVSPDKILPTNYDMGR